MVRVDPQSGSAELSGVELPLAGGGGSNPLTPPVKYSPGFTTPAFTRIIALPCSLSPSAGFLCVT